jgi:hypothetical protein
MELSGKTVTVCCRVVGGVRSRGLAEDIGLHATHPMNNVLFNGPPQTVHHTSPGIGVTTVPIEIWEQWLARNAGSPLIESGAISAS